MFKTSVSERQFLGLLYPVTDEHFYYDQLPMGTYNSPTASGHFGLSFVHHLLESSTFFAGVSMDNSITSQLLG